VIIRIITKKNAIDNVANQIKKIKVAKIISINRQENTIPISYPDAYVNETKKLKRIQRIFSKIRGIVKIQIFPIKTEITQKLSVKKKEKKKQPKPTRKSKENHKIYSFFLDIDKTITEESSSLVDTRARFMFKIMRELGHNIFLASGRSGDRVSKLIKDLETTEAGIGENGSVIMGLDNAVLNRLGDKRVCDAVVEKLRNIKKYEKKIRVEPSLKLAEAVIFKDNHHIDQLEKCINSKRVHLTATENYIHIDSARVDKGEAVEKLRERYPIPRNRVISMGDSDLDIPLFKASKISVAVGDASEEVRAAAKFKERLRLFDAVIKYFSRYERRFKEELKAERFDEILVQEKAT